MTSMITGTPSLAVRDRPRVTQCHWTKKIATPSVTGYVPDYPYLLMVLSISSREHGQCKGARLNQALAGSHCSPGEEPLPRTSLVDLTINGLTPLTCNWFPSAATTVSTTTPALLASCNICHGRCGALGYAESFVSGGAVYLQEHPLSIA